MTTAPNSETRPFNAQAANEVLEKATAGRPESLVNIVLSVRAPNNNYPMAVDDCLNEINELSEVLRAPVSPYDLFVDKNAGQIRLKALPSLCLALVQEQELFWSVALADAR